MTGQAPVLQIYCDASFRLGKGSWGAAVVLPGREKTPLQQSGPFKADCPSPFFAELWGVANALAIANVIARDHQLARVIIRCDCKPVVDWLACIQKGTEDSHGRKSIRDELEPAFAVVRAALAELDATVKFSWVEGHQPAEARKPGTPGWLNAMADRLARKSNATLMEGRRAAARRKRHKRKLRNAHQVAAPTRTRARVTEIVDPAERRAQLLGGTSNGA